MSMTTLASFQSSLLPVIKGTIGEQYDQWPDAYAQCCSMRTTDRLYDEMIASTGLGIHALKTEARAGVRQGKHQSYINRFNQLDYQTAHVITDKMLKYNQNADLVLDASSDLLTSARQTNNTLFALMMDRSRNASYVNSGEGKEMLSTSHPLGIGGTFSNLMSPAIAFSQAGLEQLILLKNAAVMENGLPAMLANDKILVPQQLYFKALKNLGTEFEVGNNNNTINPIVKNKLIPGGFVMDQYLTDTTAYYLLVTKESVKNKGLMKIDSHAPEINEDVDNDARTFTMFCFFSTVLAWHDPRAIFGTAGA